MHVEFFALIQQHGLQGDAYLSNRFITRTLDTVTHSLITCIIDSSSVYASRFPQTLSLSLNPQTASLVSLAQLA